MSRKIFAIELQAYTNIALFYNKVYFMMYICKKYLSVKVFCGLIHPISPRPTI